MIVDSFTIYHSPNAYLGTMLLRRALADLPDVVLRRRPIFVPRERGVMIAEMLGGKENSRAGSYFREDCRRWAERFEIPLSMTHEQYVAYLKTEVDVPEPPFRTQWGLLFRGYLAVLTPTSPG